MTISKRARRQWPPLVTVMLGAFGQNQGRINQWDKGSPYGDRAPAETGLLSAGGSGSRLSRCAFGALSLLALTGCATTRYVTIGCLTQSQYDQLAAAKPGKIHSQLNGSADHDLKLIAGRLIRVEAWGDGELTILGGCITKDAH